MWNYNRVWFICWFTHSWCSNYKSVFDPMCMCFFVLIPWSFHLTLNNGKSHMFFRDKSSDSLVNFWVIQSSKVVGMMTLGCHGSWQRRVTDVTDVMMSSGGPKFNMYWLVVWNIFYFSIQLGIILPTDFHIFQMGWNMLKPPTSVDLDGFSHQTWWKPLFKPISQLPSCGFTIGLLYASGVYNYDSWWIYGRCHGMWFPEKFEACVDSDEVSNT